MPDERNDVDGRDDPGDDRAESFSWVDLAPGGQSKSMFEGLVDALLGEFMPRIQRNLLEPRLLLDLHPACRGGLFRGDLICIRHRRSLSGRRYQYHMAYNDRGDNARTKCGDELRHDDALFLAELSD